MKGLLLFSILTLAWAGIMRPPSLVEQQRDALIAEANSMGYVIEHVGRIMEKAEICGQVRFDFAEWLSADIFKKYATSIFNNWTIPQEDAEAFTNELLPEFMAATREDFERNLAEEKLPSFDAYDVVHTVHFPYQWRVHPHLDRHGNVTDIEWRKALVESARNDVEQMAYSRWFGLSSRLRNFLRSKYTMDIGIRNLCEEFAKRVMGAAYEGSVMQKYGDTSDGYFLSNYSLTARVADSVIAEVCVTTHKDAGHEAFKIIPLGILHKNSYEYPLLPTLYAQDEKNPGMANLLVAGQERFRKDGIIIVTNFEIQDNRCSLVTPKGCNTASKRLDADDGTLVFPLDKKKLVITNARSARFMDQSGEKVVYLDAFIDPISWYNRILGVKIATIVAIVSALIIVLVLFINCMCKALNVQSKVKHILRR